MNTNFSIAQKLMGGFGILTIAILLSSILTYSTLNRNLKINNRINETYNPSVTLINDLFTAVSDSKMLVKNWVFIEMKDDTKDKNRLREIPATIALIKQTLTPIATRWEKAQQDTLEIILKKIDEELLPKQNEVMQQLSNFAAYNDMMVTMMIQPRVQEGGDIIKTTDEILALSSQLLKSVENEANKASMRMKDSFESFQSFVIFVGIISILLAVIIAIYTTTSIRSSLSHGLKIIDRLAEGDLTVEVKVKTQDEIGQLLEKMRKMVIKLREVITFVRSSADNIATSSNEFSNSAQQLSQGASEQASSSEEVSSAIEEMVSNIKKNTDNAQETEKIAAKAAEDIQVGGTQVVETVNSMKTIADKISIIGEISFQTNILALNAAVEAARAGIHGKGFAVVASEVRKLAERSQQAANEIDSLSKNSVDVAETSRELLDSIVPGIQNTSKLVQEITAASIEQNSGADHINTAIQQLNRVTQQNAAASEQMATSAEELSAQAKHLQDAIVFFKVSEESITKNINLNAFEPKLTIDEVKEDTFKETKTEKPKEQKTESNSTPKMPTGFNFDLGKNDSFDSDYEKF